MKPLWFIRNTHKLFTRFNYVIAFCNLLYTILTLFVIEFQLQNLLLLIVPVIALVICLCLHKIYLYVHNLSFFQAIKEDKKDAMIKAVQDTIIGVNFICVVLFLFLQTEWLNQLKKSEATMLFPIIICSIGGIIFLIYQAIKLLKLKH